MTSKISIKSLSSCLLNLKAKNEIFSVVYENSLNIYINFMELP